MSKPSASVAKGRAVKARPLARLLPAVAVAFGALLAAPAAQAVQPASPILTGTNPGSPSTATKPLVQGSADGIITSVVGPRSSVIGGPSGPGGAGASATDNPEFTITLFKSELECEAGTNPAGSGKAKDLEGAGVPVSEDVATGAVTSFFARQTDPADPLTPSGCSDPISYRHVSAPPDPPAFTSTSPPSPADHTAPFLIGTADKDATVSIYANSSCTGAPVATGTASAFAGAGIQVEVGNETETTFYARATVAGFVSSCSTSSISYKETGTTGGENPGGENPGGENPGGRTPAARLREATGRRAPTRRGGRRRPRCARCPATRPTTTPRP